ncbi:hypothetical protein D3C77_487210 [compost metagenome]
MQLAGTLQAKVEGVIEAGFSLAVERVQDHMHTTAQPAQAGACLKVQALIVEL